MSIDTTRLSEVITGCGGKLTTCSRMSTLVLTRSMNGISRLNPGESVRWYLHSRSNTSIPPHHGGSALDLDNADPFADGVALGHVIRAGQPGLAFDLYIPVSAAH